MTFQFQVPTLRTPRLKLRMPRISDFPAYAAFLASDRAAGMGGPMGQDKAWAYFCHDTALWALFGHGALMIEDSTGVVLGQVGVNAGPLFPEPELGWFLYAGHETHGFASEAAASLRDWTFANTALPTLVSYVDRNNARSTRVAERLGAALDPTALRPDPGDLVYRHIKGQA
jgi:RimJ/RimL family protein N-acetyltransferase